MKNQIYSSPNTTNQIMTGNSYEITHYRDKYLKEVDLHSHDFYELYYFISGKVSYVIDNMEYLLLPGDILLISPDNLHRPSFYENLEYERIVLWINPKYVRSLSSKTTNLGICFSQSAKEKSFLIRDYIFSEKIKDVLVNLEQL
ncbi:MAG: AraC family ligand binding domain-containing protein, partial [Clostridia bacterium]|nr:AraC family ligand binding domain-containing protein [Clostridia bacterium]